MSMTRRIGLGAWPVLLAVAAFLVVAGLTVVVLRWQGSQGGNSYDLLNWERTTFANKWVFMAGRPLRIDPSPDDAINQYFALRNRSSLEARRIENAVEAAIEGRINAVVRDLGIRGRLSLPGTVFPPVDIELAESPRVLVLSPRGLIKREGTELLRADILVREAIEIEHAIEAEQAGLSALVVPSGGVAAYPAIVSNGRTYRATLQTAAHEWVHHYLAFYPVGLGYFVSEEISTINETLADVVADEIAAEVLRLWGDPSQPPEAPSAERQPLPLEPGAVEAIDRALVLRELRLEVDALLAEGRVEQAERRMEQVRERLERAGHNIRRINQAYFAWYGTYAARADSVDPLGSQLREIRGRSGSLARFLTIIRDVTSRAEVERLIEEMRESDERLASARGDAAARR
jgi:hypothetical protein